MISTERHLRIMALLNSKLAVSIPQLQQALGASRSTIQRDLDTLEREGKIIRQRGGAVKVDLDKTVNALTDLAVDAKAPLHFEAKQQVGALAAAVVEDGDFIFIDSGTTPVALLPQLQHKHIKIATNSHYVLQQLDVLHLEAEVFMIGGSYHPKTKINDGPTAIQQINSYRFDRAFIGANGVDLALGEAYASEVSTGAIKSAVMARSTHNYLLVDHSKFGLAGLCRFAEVTDFEQIFTDTLPTGVELPENLIAH